MEPSLIGIKKYIYFFRSDEPYNAPLFKPRLAYDFNTLRLLERNNCVYETWILLQVGKELFQYIHIISNT